MTTAARASCRLRPAGARASFVRAPGPHGSPAQGLPAAPRATPVPALLLVLAVLLGLAGCGQAASQGEAAAPSDGPPAAASGTASGTASGGVPSGLTTGPGERVRPSRGADPQRDSLDAADGYVVGPVGATLSVRDAPDGGEVEVLDAVRETGAPLTLLLADDPGDGWYEVLLPVRPNGSKGWVDVDDVTVAHVPFRLEMSVSTNELRLLEEGEVVRTMPAASGTGDTPTPLGAFFLTELIEPTNAGYGPYAYGTSGFSDVLTSFGGGPGQIGLHGTDDPDSVGRSVSHGCIRLSDEDITFLAETLPLGTPVDVVETTRHA